MAASLQTAGFANAGSEILLLLSVDSSFLDR